jgi:glycosyltransferase involved in cell wall biosynthesis
MKIALVYDAIYPYIKGGAEKRYYEIGKGLTKEGHQVHFYGMKFWQGDSSIKRNGMYYHGISRPRSLYNKNGKRSIKEAVLFGISCIKLLREDFDIIDCCQFPFFSLFSCKIISKLKRKLLFTTWHEVWGKDYWLTYIGWKGWMGYIVEKLSVLMPDKIISVSDHTTNQLRNTLGSKKNIYTIPNGINVDLYGNITPAEEKSDVIFVGRLTSNKNVNVLVKSIDILKEDIPDIKTLIIGDGPERKRLEILVNKLGLESNIEFTGFMEKQNDIYSKIKSSRVLVLPSSREGFGIIVIEANACGIPVITVDHIGNAAKDLIKPEKNGFICCLDEAEIKEYILKVLENNSNEQMKKECQYMSRQYDWAKITNEVEEVYLS